MLEFSIAPESIHSLLNLLTIALGLSLLLCLWFVLPLVGRRWRFGRRWGVLCKLLFAGLASLQVFAWHLYFYRQSHDAIEFGYLVAAVAVGAFLWWLATVKPNSLHPRLARWLPAALACLAIVQLAGFAVVTKCFADFKPNYDMPVVAPPGQLVVSDEVFAQTDLGTKIDLYERTASREEFAVFINSTRANMNAMAGKAMRRDEPCPNTNCHGWVFTAGTFIVQGQDVGTILNDNGYVEVATPELNDVVVYCDDQGQVLHTGVVRGFLNGDAALVESKWGIDGTYLHLATEQPYSQNISYWHTSRGTHTLSTVSAHAAPSTGTR